MGENKTQTMSKIKILPESLSNKIAAGEVVERPSSVVKELVENALDADSTRLIIEVDNGGRSLIRVSDDGTGMSRDDALLAIERYATSKIKNERDLFSIDTLGFRGEALPSIAAVSRFSLVTREETSETGTEIIVEGGKIKDVSEVGAPSGTMITVKQIFFNTPARRKFLKTVNTEMGHIADIVASIAMGRPDVQFKLLHNRKIVKNWSLASDPLERVIDILGKDIKNYLHRIESKDNNLSISGWISSPRFTRKTSRGIYVYVNGRFVRDRVIQHALFDGYRERLVKGQFPLGVLFMHIPFDQVDVNVHPTKNEIRFVNQRNVHEKVAKIVSETLKLSDRTKWASPKFQQEEKHYISESVAEFGRRTTDDGRQWSEVRGQRSEVRDQRAEDSNQKAEDRKRRAEDGRQGIRFDLPVKQEALWEKKQFGDLRIIGQLQSTYILCESDEGLVLIDQHAAHERILFEQLKKRSKAHKVASQRLLIPETLDVGYKEAEILNKLIPELTELGLDIEPFGGNTFVIKSVPALIINREIKPVLIGLLEKLVETGFSSGFDKTIEQCLILMACHGAIRANQHLSDKQMKVLLEQLDECDNPSHCPHGRPTWIKWTTRLIEKSFNRIV